MKILRYTYALLLPLLLIALSGCEKKDVSENSECASFGVIRSEADFDFNGGIGMIELSESDFAFSVPAGSDTWLKVTKTGSRALKLETPRNDTGETRSSLVTVDKAGNKVYVPVTQTARKDFAEIESVTFKPAGGQKSFAVDFDSEPQITIEDDDSWFTVEIIDGETLVVDVTPNTGVSTRRASVTVKAGLYSTTFSITQTAALEFKPGKIVYQDILGSYTFTGFIEGEEYNVPVKVEALEPGKTVLMKGLAIDFVLEVDEAKNVIRMKSDQVTPSGVYYSISSGMGDNDCSIFDLLGEGKAIFEAPAEVASGHYRFVFKSPNKADCEVTADDGSGEYVPTGEHKEPTGVVLIDYNNMGFYFGPDGESLGVFFDFYMIQD